MVGVEISLKISINKNTPPGHGPCIPTHTSLGAALGDVGNAASSGRYGLRMEAREHLSVSCSIGVGRSPWSSPVLFSVISDLIRPHWEQAFVLSSSSFISPPTDISWLALSRGKCLFPNPPPLPWPHPYTHMYTHVHTCELVSNTQLGNPPALLFLV